MPVLFFARDPGPANYLVAVHDLVSMPDVDAGAAVDVVREIRSQMPSLVFGRGSGIDVWRRAKIAHRNLDEVLQSSAAFDEKVALLSTLMQQEKITRVVTGASDVDENTDRSLWAAAKANGILSHSFLDHPASLDRRFLLADGTQILPDYIHAPDDAYLSILTEANVPLDRVTVTGPIHTQRLRRIAVRGEEEQLLRAGWGAKSGDKVVLFASECIQEMAEAGRPRGYSEFDVLGDLTVQLEQGNAIGPVKAEPSGIVLVVRPHPRDREGKYLPWQSMPGRLRRIVSSEGAPERAILAADVVVGMDSSLLRDALALGQPVVSLVGADLSV